MAKISKASPDHDPFKAADGIAAELAGLLDEPKEPESPTKVTLPKEATPEPKTKTVTPQPKPKAKVRPVAKRATEPVKAQKAQPTKRLKVTAEERREWDQAALRMGARVGTTIGFSKMTRALWDIYLRHEEDILRNVPDGTAWDCPSTSNADELAALDHNLAELLNDGLMAACLRTRRRERDEG